MKTDKKIISKLKAIAGDSFACDPEVKIDEVFDLIENAECHLALEMVRQKLIWSEDGLVGFEGDKAVKILFDEWPEFRQHIKEENAIEEDVNRGSTANPFASASEAYGRRASIADEFAAAGDPLGDDEG